MTSIRRVKKGPGRRPQSAKRQRFVQLRERGWSISAAARAVGASRSSGNNWSRGYKVYRRGQVVGFVPPLERLAVREVSSRYLSQDERVEIADLHHGGLSIRQIAGQVGRAPSTVSRELRRNASSDGRYRPFHAHRRATLARARDHKRRVESIPQLGEAVGELLGQRWSPQQISRHLRAKHANNPAMWLCHESIYQAVYQPGSTLVRPAKVPSPQRSPLRTGRQHRRAQQHVARRRPRFDQPMKSVHERPFPPDDRAEAGHWEGDLIIGKDQASAIGTVVERTTRTIRLLHMPTRDADALHAAITTRMSDLPPTLLRSITWDQGTEMARHLSISHDLGADVYFCDSRSPWQRGSNENANGLLRQYFPKGTDLSVHSPKHLRAVEDEINSRPRLVLDDQTPAAVFNALLASETPEVLRR